MPFGVHLAEIVGDATEGDLLPIEALALGFVTDKRRREFVEGRACARRAMAMLGVAPVPVLIGTHREPIWPNGVVGSITHCDGMRAAVAARSTTFASIGIDAEPNQALPRDVHGLVILPEEHAELAALGTGTVHWDRLVFCAKECFYKAWFPLTRRWLDFTDVRVTFAPERGQFRVELRAAVSRAEQMYFRDREGRFRITESHLLTFYGVEAC